MAKKIVLALLCGALAMAIWLYLYFAIVSPGNTPPAIRLEASAARVDAGTADLGGGSARLTLDTAGLGVLAWTPGDLDPVRYPILYFAFRGPLPANFPVVFWKFADTGQDLSHYRVPGATRASHWLSLSASPEWRDRPVELGFIFKGRPGQQVTLESVQLLPLTPGHLVRAILADWLAPLSWDHASINRNAGDSPRALTQPVPVIAALLGLSLCCYAVLVRTRPRIPFDWGIVAGVFLVGWIGLDLLWQLRVLGQLGDTRIQYAGRSTAEKLAAGPDAALVEFTADIKHRVTSADARIFVGSDDDYTGMRSAYYLYPYNVYWSRHDEQLPAPGYLRPGDYIVVLSSTYLRFEEQGRVLLTGAGERIPAERVTSGAVGSLFRLY